MTTNTFHEERMSGIGGTDASGICRANPYKCPLQVYLEKIGSSEEKEDNMYMWLGRSLEENLKSKYELENNFNVTTPGVLRHHTYDYLMAHVDGIVENSHVVEFKTSSNPSKWGEERSGEALISDVPLEYYYQVQHYLMITGLEKAHIYVLLYGFQIETRLYEFKRNNLFISKMRCKLMDFWVNNVMKKVPPKALTRDEVAMLHPKPTPKKKVEASKVDLEKANELSKIKAEMNQLKKKEKACKDLLAASIQDAEELVSGDIVIASFKSNKNGTRSLRMSS